MKIGSINYATEQGLGYLMKSFYDNHVVNNVAIIHHGSRPDRLDWYPPNTPRITRLHQPDQIHILQEFCKQQNIVLFFETPFIWELIPFCREHGVKTVIMPMYECMPRQWLYQPDAILNPSLLDQQYYPRGTYIPVPVETTWKKRFIAETFIHNAGHGGLKGRNGTAELITAMQYVQSNIKLIIRTQSRDIGPISSIDKRVTVVHATVPRGELYDYGDVFVFPEKFNGLSLPLQEATASGMAVMTTARFPNTKHYPKIIPINVTRYRQSCVSNRCVVFDEAIIDPRSIAAAIDDTYGKDITTHSVAGHEWYANHMSWNVLHSRYMEFFECLLKTPQS
jgi:hypothetical protein